MIEDTATVYHTVITFLLLSTFASLYLLDLARQRAKDYATDLRTLIVSGTVDSRDLRRSLRHSEVRDKLIEVEEKELEESLEDAKMEEEEE